MNLANNRASTSPATLPSGIICAMARSQREFQLLPVHRATNKVRLGGLRPNYCQTGAIAFQFKRSGAPLSAALPNSPSRHLASHGRGFKKKAPEWVSGAPTPKPLPLGYGEAMLTIGSGRIGTFIKAVRSAITHRWGDSCGT